ncbi:mevalonate kinase [Streptococcus pseudopneumoniae]|uniref:Mevalonate kinase n=1 Tax=Streptococcus pseudopneumoniae TaxID=257758 RepID=A0A1S9ZAH9_9STRE|nr:MULTISPECIES: mevalonate kinase [Streptococcus]AEL09905.1 mevalonate kinase [Streptococcus pseudopneumoniae IS7493]EID24807.1 mevalonate kinase [Streptococcus pseudopneumoniae ATCC BAA-960 = CCUG 49455]EID70301.1 mevalonate kinase [Streptococcus pseudopneumoniae SK674]ETD93026.1 mevalonate kinase [Streptococcus pseudopneumoniae 1321]ETD98684.1 mevalonate kinase [Streptococcus pseudopneumoniae 5247]
MTKKVGVGQAHSKIILIGEHAVVYGYPAISLPLLEVEVTCKVVPAESPWRLYEEDTLSMAVYASLEYLDITEACIRCEIDSAIPEKRGMGSSAAISIAAIRAVFDYYQADLPHDVLEILVNRAEMIAHMNPSGLDAKTCLSDQPIRFIKNVGFTELEMDLSAYLVIADTGVYGHTREAIQVVQNKGKDALPFLHALGELTQQAEDAISQKDAEELGQILSQAHLHLKEIGVSSPEADHLVETALSHGALGAKMSGGGLGGCIIALADNLTHAQELAERLEEKGAVQTWIESL